MYDKLLDVPPGTKIKEQTFLATNDTNNSITWAIKDDSNLNNQTGANGIEPGSSGSLTFYIISHKDGPLSLTLDVALTGYSYGGEDDKEPTTSADITPVSYTHLDVYKRQMLIRMANRVPHPTKESEP